MVMAMVEVKLAGAFHRLKPAMHVSLRVFAPQRRNDVAGRMCLAGSGITAPGLATPNYTQRLQDL